MLSRGGGPSAAQVWTTPAFADCFDVSTLSDSPPVMLVSTAPSNWSARPAAGVWRFGRVLPSEGGDGGVQWVLKRNCSLTPGQLLGFYASVCVVSLGIAVGFAWNGAPVVIWFAGIELLLLALALLFYARHATDADTVTLSGQDLTVEQSFGALRTSARFRTPWVSVEPSQGDGSLIELSGQGQVARIGRFLRPEARADFARELRSALRHSLQSATAPADAFQDHFA
jgi:uncharacterized membrane protein